MRKSIQLHNIWKVKNLLVQMGVVMMFVYLQPAHKQHIDENAECS